MTKTLGSSESDIYVRVLWELADISRGSLGGGRGVRSDGGPVPGGVAYQLVVGR